MKSKYINTFDTSTAYNAYIESAYPEFPNIGYIEDTGEIKYKTQSPNNHLIYGDIANGTSDLSLLINGTSITCTVDSVEDTFYLDYYSGTVTALNSCCRNNSIISIKKLNLDTSNVTTLSDMFYVNTTVTSVNLSGCDFSNVDSVNTMFYGCTALRTVDLSGCDFSNVASASNMFYNCPALRTVDLSGCDFSNITQQSSMFGSTYNIEDVYITEEGTLMKLTNNLTGIQGSNFIPHSATIHYNGSQYKWQDNAWTLQ